MIAAAGTTAESAKEAIEMSTVFQRGSARLVPPDGAALRLAVNFRPSREAAFERHWSEGATSCTYITGAVMPQRRFGGR